MYPYEYINGYHRFNERQLPPKEAFYSKLTRESVSDKDYQHAKNVWQTCECQTWGDYHDLYLRTDVLLLADVFETFRRTAQAYMVSIRRITSVWQVCVEMPY